MRNWEAGEVRIPYAAYKLLRILKNGWLLGPEWRGYSIHRDVLHTPEGHTFKASELAWWSFLVRQAREFQRGALERRQGPFTARVDIPVDLALVSELSMPRRPGAVAGKDPSSVELQAAPGRPADATQRGRGNGAKPLKEKGFQAESLSLTLPVRPAITHRKQPPTFTPLRPIAPSRSLRSRAQKVLP